MRKPNCNMVNSTTLEVSYYINGSFRILIEEDFSVIEKAIINEVKK